jgi:hypothetical protein
MLLNFKQQDFNVPQGIAKDRCGDLNPRSRGGGDDSCFLNPTATLCTYVISYSTPVRILDFKKDVKLQKVLM